VYFSEIDAAYKAMTSVKQNTVRDITLDCSISHKSEHFGKNPGFRRNNHANNHASNDQASIGSTTSTNSIKSSKTSASSSFVSSPIVTSNKSYAKAIATNHPSTISVGNVTRSISSDNTMQIATGNTSFPRNNITIQQASSLSSDRLADIGPLASTSIATYQSVTATPKTSSAFFPTLSQSSVPESSIPSSNKSTNNATTPNNVWFASQSSELNAAALSTSFGNPSFPSAMNNSGHPSLNAMTNNDLGTVTSHFPQNFSNLSLQSYQSDSGSTTSGSDKTKLLSPQWTAAAAVSNTTTTNLNGELVSIIHGSAMKGDTIPLTVEVREVRDYIPNSSVPFQQRKSGAIATTTITNGKTNHHHNHHRQYSPSPDEITEDETDDVPSNNGMIEL
jgi:hypothetical protein